MLSLRKVVLSALSDNQVEFEGLKLELTQKNDEQEELRGQLDEAARLREIAEKQLDEALEALKDEREQKNSLRRELSALTLNPFDSVGNLELHLDQLDDSQQEDREGQDQDQDSGINNGPGSAPGSAPPPRLGGSKNNGLVHRYSTPRNSDVFLRAPASGLVSDLLSELQFSDSQKLKQQLLQVTSTRVSLPPPPPSKPPALALAGGTVALATEAILEKATAGTAPSQRNILFMGHLSGGRGCQGVVGAVQQSRGTKDAPPLNVDGEKVVAPTVASHDHMISDCQGLTTLKPFYKGGVQGPCSRAHSAGGLVYEISDSLELCVCSRRNARRPIWSIRWRSCRCSSSCPNRPSASRRTKSGPSPNSWKP